MPIEAKPTSQIINNERLQAVRNALKNGISSDLLLTKIANRKEKEVVNQIGTESEKRFDEYTKNIKFVKNVSAVHTIENLFLGIDRWISFDKSLSLPELPVQIKSSRGGVNIFKFGDPKKGIDPNPIYTHLSGLIIVINCGQTTTFKGFRSDLLNEANRIRSLLETNHTSVDSFILQSLKR